jgi:hypothetical protein
MYNTGYINEKDKEPGGEVEGGGGETPGDISWATPSPSLPPPHPEHHLVGVHTCLRRLPAALPQLEPNANRNLL